MINLEYQAIEVSLGVKNFSVVFQFVCPIVLFYDFPFFDTPVLGRETYADLEDLSRGGNKSKFIKLYVSLNNSTII